MRWSPVLKLWFLYKTHLQFFPFHIATTRDILIYWRVTPMISLEKHMKLLVRMHQISRYRILIFCGAFGSTTCIIWCAWNEEPAPNPLIHNITLVNERNNSILAEWLQWDELRCLMLQPSTQNSEWNPIELLWNVRCSHAIGTNTVTSFGAWKIEFCYHSSCGCFFVCCICISSRIQHAFYSFPNISSIYGWSRCPECAQEQ